MIDVTENEDGTFTISWDENDPQESILNNYTENDFKALIKNYLDKVNTEQDYANKRGQNTTIFKDKPIKGSINPEENITEATKEDWEDFWEEK